MDNNYSIPSSFHLMSNSIVCIERSPTVFVFRILQPCSKLKDVFLMKSKSLSGASNRRPSPSPSTKRAPTLVPALITKSSLYEVELSQKNYFHRILTKGKRMNLVITYEFHSETEYGVLQDSLDHCLPNTQIA